VYSLADTRGCGANVDVHDQEGGVWTSYRREVGGAKGWYYVPYRILLPRDVEGLPVAGRCVSSDHNAQGVGRGGLADRTPKIGRHNMA
jgi:hypothetical protein